MGAASNQGDHLASFSGEACRMRGHLPACAFDPPPHTDRCRDADYADPYDEPVERACLHARIVPRVAQGLAGTVGGVR
jgi:hypothetical protein